jgi:cytochrome c553
MKKLLVLGLLTASAFAYMDCAMCHVKGGMATPLTKYTPAQINKMLHEIKANKLNAPSMTGIVSGMSDADMKDAAKKYGKK